MGWFTNFFITPFIKAATSVASFFKHTIESVADAVVQTVGAVVGVAVGVVKTVVDIVTLKPVDVIAKDISDTLSAVTTHAVNIVHDAVNIVNAAVDAVTDVAVAIVPIPVVREVVASLAETIDEGVENLLHDANTIIEKALTSAVDAVASTASAAMHLLTLDAEAVGKDIAAVAGDVADVANVALLGAAVGIADAIDTVGDTLVSIDPINVALDVVADLSNDSAVTNAIAEDTNSNDVVTPFTAFADVVKDAVNSVAFTAASLGHVVTEVATGTVAAVSLTAGDLLGFNPEAIATDLAPIGTDIVDSVTQAVPEVVGLLTDAVLLVPNIVTSVVAPEAIASDLEDSIDRTHLHNAFNGDVGLVTIVDPEFGPITTFVESGHEYYQTVFTGNDVLTTLTGLDYTTHIA